MNTRVPARPARTIDEARISDASLSPGFDRLLADANAAWVTLHATPLDHPDRAFALRGWSAACLLVVTGIRTAADAQALNGLDGRTADDWIDFLISLGISAD